LDTEIICLLKFAAKVVIFFGNGESAGKEVVCFGDWKCKSREKTFVWLMNNKISH
jgi:hypothetical protein